MDTQRSGRTGSAVAFDFLAGGGEMGAMMRAYDWARSPLGPPETWPDALRMAVSLCLGSRFPILLMWGDDLITLYNDAWRPVAGARKHPSGFARPVSESWSEIWDTVGPQLQAVLREGTATWARDLPLFVDRYGYLEETFFSYSYSPIRDADGRIGGVFTAVYETTDQVLSQRRLDLLRQLAEATADRRSVAEVAQAAAAVLTGQPEAVFSAIYLVDGAAPARLASPPFGHLLAEVTLDGSDRWGIARTFRSGVMTVLDDLDSRFGEMPRDPWPEPPGRAVALPLARPDQSGAPAGVLVIGINPRRRLDEAYVAFLRLVAGQVAAALTAARAYEAERRRAETLTAAANAGAAAAAVAQARNAELQAVLDAVPTPVWFTRDRDASTAWGNREAAELLRLPHPGMHALADTDRTQLGFTVHRDGRPVTAEALPLQRAAHGEETPAEELEIRFRDGGSRHVVSRGRPLRDATGAVTGAVLVVVDITDRKTAEAELQRANETLESRVAERTAALERSLAELRAQMQERERMEATLRRMQRLEAVGQLTAGVAHDFNNLLTVILGNVEFLARDLPDRARRRLSAVRAAAERGATLTSQLLAFARRQQLRPREADLNEVITGMSDLLRTTAGGTIEVRTALQPTLWPALVDTTQIELVILNLALNARDAMPEGGVLTIATGNTSLGPPHAPEQPEAGDYVTITVADTGTGMTPDVLARAVEPFFTTKPPGKGSGLGLAQVYGFAQQSGGGVEIETVPGLGTTVRVHLPRAPAAASVPLPVAAPQPPEPPRACVLVVDDDATVRDVTMTMLQDAGYAAIQAESGAAALTALQTATRVDMLLADFAMPGMSGTELARAVRAAWPDLPILFITGYADAGMFEGLDRAMLLRKPFRSGELVARVAGLLGHDAAGAAPGTSDGRS